MMFRKPFFAGAVLGADGLAVSGGLVTSLGQSAAPPRPPVQHRFHVPGQHVEGRIAFLKAELKITDAQQPQFDKVAAAMRDNAAAMRQAFESMRPSGDTPPNAVQRLEMRAKFAALRAQASQRTLDAFKPLYDSLSDEQRKTADELLGHFHGRR